MFFPDPMNDEMLAVNRKSRTYIFNRGKMEIEELMNFLEAKFARKRIPVSARERRFKRSCKASPPDFVLFLNKKFSRVIFKI